MADNREQPWAPEPARPAPGAVSADDQPDLTELATERLPTPAASARPSHSLATFLDGEPTHILPALSGQDLTEMDTVALPALPRPGRNTGPRAAGAVAALRQSLGIRAPAPSERLRATGARLALMAALCLLGVRAGVASLAFMTPGGDVVGWSRLPVVHHLTPVVSVPHQLTPA